MNSSFGYSKQLIIKVDYEFNFWKHTKNLKKICKFFYFRPYLKFLNRSIVLFMCVNSLETSGSVYMLCMCRQLIITIVVQCFFPFLLHSCCVYLDDIVGASFYTSVLTFIRALIIKFFKKKII